MALKPSKKKAIIADWKTGRFKTPASLSKHHKVDRKTVVKIVNGISFEHSTAVEAGVAFEREKSQKNPTELRAIETAVKERTKLERIADLVVEAGHKVALQSSAEIVRRNSDKKIEKLELSEIKLGTEIIEKSMRIVAPPKETQATNIQMTQMMSDQEETVNETVIITDNRDMLEKMGLL
ncbi:MAG: hypothetical protein DRG30_01445 [Epsilonproteobacteria bacterium]|nr:MAG: hypothetical protein DRG30_01445 [Campylobacterota bacterium]